MKNKISVAVYNPAGIVETVNTHAPRLDTLSSKTLCELTNGMYEYQRMFPVIRELLQERFPDVKIIPYTEFPIGMTPIDVEGIGELIKEKGGDGVIGAILMSGPTYDTTLLNKADMAYYGEDKSRHSSM